METWLIIFLSVLGLFLLIGLFRAVSRRSQYGWDFGDFIMELLLIDAMSDIFSGSSGGGFDSFDGGFDFFD